MLRASCRAGQCGPEATLTSAAHASRPIAHPWPALRDARRLDRSSPGARRAAQDARSLGRRSHPRTREVRDRHARRAQDSLHDTAPPAPHGRLRRAASEERSTIGWSRRRCCPMRDLVVARDAAATAAPYLNLGPGYGDVAACSAACRYRIAHLLLRATVSVATGHQRKHQRAFAPILSKGTDFTRYDHHDLRLVATALNDRPRKVLGWKTPAEAFAACM